MSKRVAPGIWIDGDGHTHLSVPELLQVAGIEDTPENRASVTNAINDMLRNRFPQAEIIERQNAPMPPSQN